MQQGFSCDTDWACWAENKLKISYKQAKNHLSLSNPAEKGELGCGSTAASHRHQTAVKGNISMLTPALDQTLLFADTPGWVGTQAFSHPSIPSWAHQHCFYADAAKYSHLLPRQGLVSRKSAREVLELQPQDRARLLPAWSSWPGLWKDTRAFSKGSAPSHRKIPLWGLAPLPQPPACPLF